MKSVFVTGASGFIGRHLAAMLRERQFEVTCLIRRTSHSEQLTELGCQLVYGDVIDPETLVTAVHRANPDQVFHLAGATKAKRNKLLFDVNQMGTRNLLEALAGLESPPTTVIVSSLAAAGPTTSKPRVEMEDPAPISYYGKSKLAGEHVARQFCDRVPLSIVRPPIVFGPHDRDGLEMFKTVANVGLHPVPSLNGMSVSWIQVSDVCRAFLAVAESGKRLNATSTAEGVYFAASDQIVEYAELGKRIGDALGRRTVWALPTPRPFVWTLALMNEFAARFKGKPSIFNLDKAREATAGSWTCSGQKLIQHTGFTCEASLTDTLQLSANWYREAGWL